MNIKVALSNINPYTFTFRKSQDISKHNNLEKTPEKDVFEMSVGYVNDLHGQTNNMTRILSGIKGDLKLSAGDNDIGDEKNKAVNRAVMKFMNFITALFTALFFSSPMSLSPAESFKSPLIPDKILVILFVCPWRSFT